MDIRTPHALRHAVLAVRADEMNVKLVVHLLVMLVEVLARVGGILEGGGTRMRALLTLRHVTVVMSR